MKRIKLDMSPDIDLDDGDQSERLNHSIDSIQDENSREIDNISSSPASAESPDLSHDHHTDDLQTQESLSHQQHLTIQEQSQQHHIAERIRPPSPLEQAQPPPPLPPAPSKQQSQQSQSQQQQQQNQNNQTSIQRVIPGAPANFCNICNKELCNKYFMKTHMQKMHGINLDDYPREAANSGGVVCDICQKELCSKYFLKVHKSNTHGISDFTSGSPGSQAANAATAVAAIALTNTLNNAQKRAALNLALNQHQIQSRQAAALMNAAAASAAFNPLQIQAAKAAALHQQQHQSHQQQQQQQQQQAPHQQPQPQQSLPQRNQMSQANSIINHLQAQQHFDPQHVARSHSPLQINSLQQNAQQSGENLSHPSPTSNSSPMTASVPGLNMVSLPAALLAASAAANNQTMLINQFPGQENPFSSYRNISSPLNQSLRQEPQLPHQYMSHDDNQPESDDEASDRDSLVELRQERLKNHPTFDQFHQQFQNHQALLNAVAFNPTAATAAIVALQQEQQQQQHQSILNNTAPRQNVAMDLRSPTINHLLAQQVAVSQRSQNMMSGIPGNNLSQYTQPEMFDHQSNVRPQQRVPQKQRNQRKRPNASQRASMKREVQEEEVTNVQGERNPIDIPNALITLAVQQAHQAAASRQPSDEISQNCGNDSNNTNGATSSSTHNSANSSSRYLRHYTEACPICDRRFKSIKWLQSHVMNDHKNEIGNLFNLLVQVLLCGNGGAGGTNAIPTSNSTNTIGNNLVNISRTNTSMAQLDDNTSSTTSNSLINTLMNSPSLPSPMQQQSPQTTTTHSGNLGPLGGLSSTLASLIGLQQQIHNLQGAASAQQQQQQRLGMVLSQPNLPLATQQPALSTSSIASLATSANNQGNI